MRGGGMAAAPLSLFLKEDSVYAPFWVLPKASAKP